MEVHPKNPWIDVRRLRRDQGWRQWEAAEKLGVTRAYLSAVENGRRGFSKTMMEAIVRVFGVKYEDFYNQNNL